MKIAKALFCMVAAFWLLLACGTSSSDENGASDDRGAAGSGGSDGGAVGGGGSDGDAGEACNLFGDASGISGCSQGQVCCYTDSSMVCRDPETCNSRVRFDCRTSDDCHADEVCCGTFWPLPGVDDASVPPASSLDASPRVLDGGAEAGQERSTVEVIATTVCAVSCYPPDYLICRNSADCQGETVCGSMPEGSKWAILAIAAEAFLVCISTE